MITFGLLIVSAFVVAAFVLVERRVAEPMMPMRLFGSQVFSLSSAIMLLIGFAMLGVLTYLPVFLQYVQHVNATSSGLRTLPLILGLLIASMISASRVSVTGRYRLFLVAGGIVLGIGMFLLSQLTAQTSILGTSLCLFLIGTGAGLSMQVLVVVAQSTVEYRDLGAATSAISFFRSMGGAFGAAVFGAIYAGQIARHLPVALAAAGLSQSTVLSPTLVQRLPPGQATPMIAAYTQSLHVVFFAGVPVAILVTLLAILLKEIPLRDTSPHNVSDEPVL